MKRNFMAIAAALCLSCLAMFNANDVAAQKTYNNPVIKRFHAPDPDGTRYEPTTAISIFTERRTCPTCPFTARATSLTGRLWARLSPMQPDRNVCDPIRKA